MLLEDTGDVGNRTFRGGMNGWRCRFMRRWRVQDRTGRVSYFGGHGRRRRSDADGGGKEGLGGPTIPSVR